MIMYLRSSPVAGRLSCFVQIILLCTLTVAAFVPIPAHGFSSHSTQVRGWMQLGTHNNVNMSWVLSNATQPGAGSIAITLTWSDVDWAAVGFSSGIGASMPNAEVFMCATTSATPEVVCQVRNTKAGYVTPTLDSPQYLQVVGYSKQGGRTSATFARSVAAVASSPLSYPVAFDSLMGIIYASGAWSGAPPPAGTPLKHQGTAGVAEVNFHIPGRQPPPSPSKVPGVWPDRFIMNTTSTSFADTGNPYYPTMFYGPMIYDWPNRLWMLYYTPVPGEAAGQVELWNGTSMYKWFPGTSPLQCVRYDLGFGMIRPTWLRDSSNYTSTHWLLQQPNHGAHIGPSLGEYVAADLYVADAPVGGFAYSWVVRDSKDAAAVRLEGPDTFNGTKYVGIIEGSTFAAHPDPFPPGTFDMPAACHTASAVVLPADHDIRLIRQFAAFLGNY